jgi:hypothetical protein
LGALVLAEDLLQLLLEVASAAATEKSFDWTATVGSYLASHMHQTKSRCVHSVNPTRRQLEISELVSANGVSGRPSVCRSDTRNQPQMGVREMREWKQLVPLSLQRLIRGDSNIITWEFQQLATGYFDHQPQAKTHSLIRRTQSTPNLCLQMA